MNLRNIKNCKYCSNAIVYGSGSNIIIYCNSIDYTHRNNFSKDRELCASYCNGYEKATINRCGEINQQFALQFILAGNSEFILHSTKTNEDFRYELIAKESNLINNKGKIIFFLYVIYEHEKLFAGTIWFDNKTNDFVFSTGENGRLLYNKIEIKSLLFVLNKLYKEETVQFLKLYSVGKCGLCKDRLNTTEEINIGLHKKCKDTINYEGIFKVNKEDSNNKFNNSNLYSKNK